MHEPWLLECQTKGYDKPFTTIYLLILPILPIYVAHNALVFA